MSNPNENVPPSSKLDLENLSNLVDGECFTAESGDWSIHHYGTGGVVLLSQDITVNTGAAGFEFKNIDDALKFFAGEKVKFKPLSTDI